MHRSALQKMNKIGFLLISIFLWTPWLCAEEFSARVDRAFAEQTQAFLGVYPEVRRHLTSTSVFL